MRRLFLFLAVMAYETGAVAACPEDAIDPNEVSSPTDPVQMVIQDPCIFWNAGTGAVDHYHIYVAGLMRASQGTRTYQHTIAEKRVVEQIVVEAVATDVASPDAPLSDPLYVEWVDRQCLEGNKVVPC